MSNYESPSPSESDTNPCEIVIPLDDAGNPTNPPQIAVGPEFTAVEWILRHQGEPAPARVDSVKFYMDSGKTEPLTIEVFQQGYNPQPALGAKVAENRWMVPILSTYSSDKVLHLNYTLYYEDGSVEHQDDPGLTIDPRGG